MSVFILCTSKASKLSTILDVAVGDAAERRGAPVLVNLQPRVAQGRHSLSVQVARHILSPRAERVQGRRRMERAVEKAPRELARLTDGHHQRRHPLQLRSPLQIYQYEETYIALDVRLG